MLDEIIYYLRMSITRTAGSVGSGRQVIKAGMKFRKRNETKRNRQKYCRACTFSGTFSPCLLLCSSALHTMMGPNRSDPLLVAFSGTPQKQTYFVHASHSVLTGRLRDTESVEADVLSSWSAKAKLTFLYTQTGLTHQNAGPEQFREPKVPRIARRKQPAPSDV